MNLQAPLLSVRDLKVHYPVRMGMFHLGEKPTLKAVDGVSFDVFPGEVLGLVGESGCGKSSLGRAIMRLNKATSGSVEISGTDFLSLHGKALRQFRPHIQMVFQDPYASLDSRMTISDILAEPLQTHTLLSKKEISLRIQKLVDVVGLASRALNKYPHEFSGGQRQRVAIARALILDPKIIVADEPVSSLDVSVQAQILNLLKQIQKEFALSMIFISHNLAVVRYIANRVAVMYLGKIVELAPNHELYRSPRHPYTQALLSAVPIPDPKLERARKRIQLVGELPSPVHPPSGCTFHTRCPIAIENCKGVLSPSLKTLGEDEAQVSCFEVEKNFLQKPH